MRALHFVKIGLTYFIQWIHNHLRFFQKLSAKVVIKAICAVPEKDVSAVLETLSELEHDILMKYLYRALESTESNAQLLRWHGALTEKAGLGCIMRALQPTNRL